MTIFDYNYLYSACTDDAIVFLKDINFVMHFVDTFHFFPKFVGIGTLKGVQVTFFGMRYIDLNIDILKMLDTYFSYNEKLKERKNFYKIVTDMQRVLKMLKMRMLKLERKIVFYKTIAISKIFFQALIRTVSKRIVNEIKKNTKSFFSSPKIKNEYLCNNYKTGGLKQNYSSSMLLDKNTL